VKCLPLQTFGFQITKLWSLVGGTHKYGNKEDLKQKSELSFMLADVLGPRIPKKTSPPLVNQQKGGLVISGTPTVGHYIYINFLLAPVWALHRCVCIWQYILQNYNYKLHFQNLSIYHIPHVFMGPLAAENLDVCTACDPWDSNIQLTMVKDRRRQIYPKCHSNRKLTTILISKSWGWACLS
jgi:hypothetical protein